MTTEELNRKILVILSQVPSRGGMAMYKFRNPARLLMPSQLEDFVADVGEAEVANEQLLLIRALYSQCNSDLKKQFVTLLLAKINETNAKFICHAVLEVGELKDLNFVLPRLDASLGVWQGLNEKVAMESHRFTESDLDCLEQMVIGNLHLIKSLITETGRPSGLSSFSTELARLKSRIDKVRYLRLKKELFEGQNPEINTDRETLVSRLETLGFRKEIVYALHELDIKLYEAGKPLDFKGCMDLLRTIYEEVIEDAAKRVAQIKGEGELEYAKPFQPWNQYLENKGILNGSERKLAQELYNYLSTAGAHQLGSAPEQARVSRNMVIELGLMVVGRVQGLI